MLWKPVMIIFTQTLPSVYHSAKNAEVFFVPIKYSTETCIIDNILLIEHETTCASRRTVYSNHTCTKKSSGWLPWPSLGTHLSYITSFSCMWCRVINGPFYSDNLLHSNCITGTETELILKLVVKTMKSYLKTEPCRKRLSIKAVSLIHINVKICYR